MFCSFHITMKRQLHSWMVNSCTARWSTGKRSLISFVSLHELEVLLTICNLGPFEPTLFTALNISFASILVMNSVTLLRQTFVFRLGFHILSFSFAAFAPQVALNV